MSHFEVFTCMQKLCNDFQNRWHLRRSSQFTYFDMGMTVKTSHCLANILSVLGNTKTEHYVQCCRQQALQLTITHLSSKSVIFALSC